MTMSINTLVPRLQPEQGVESRPFGGAEETSRSTPSTDASVRPEQIDEAALRIADHFAAQRTDLRFRVDDDSGTLVIAVVDAVDGTVLRQIPGEEALRIAQSLQRLRSRLMDTFA